MSRIPLTPCESINIKAHGYDAATRTLAIKFSGGAIWHYAGVTPEIYSGLVAAPSCGSFFAKSIRNNYRGEQQEAQA